jgi:hypothetical protein
LISLPPAPKKKSRGGEDRKDKKLTDEEHIIKRSKQTPDCDEPNDERKQCNSKHQPKPSQNKKIENK